MKAFCDVHLHNYLSNCSKDRAATAENMVWKAAELGLKKMGFANHIWDSRVEGASSWYHKQTLEFSMQIKNQIPADTRGVEVLVGAETEYCGRNRTLGMTAEGAKELDFLLIPHSHVHMVNFVMDDPAPMAEARQRLKGELMKIPGMTQELADGWVDPLREPALRPFISGSMEEMPQYLADFLVESFDTLMEHPELHKILEVVPVSVAHPFQPVGYGGLQEAVLERIEDSTFRRIFGKAAALGVGLELNPRCGDPALVRMNAIAKECGCKFTLGSDAHSPDGMPNILKTEDAMEALGLTNDDLMEFLL